MDKVSLLNWLLEEEKDEEQFFHPSNPKEILYAIIAREIEDYCRENFNSGLTKKEDFSKLERVQAYKEIYGTTSVLASRNVEAMFLNNGHGKIKFKKEPQK